MGKLTQEIESVMHFTYTHSDKQAGDASPSPGALPGIRSHKDDKRPR